jgi:hypothetical protein
VAACAVGVSALVAAVVPGWSFLAIPLGVVAAGLALSALLLRRRGRLWSGGALVLAAGTVALTGVPLSASDTAASDPAAPALEAARGGSGPDVPVEPVEPVDPAATVVTYEIATDGLSVTHLSYVDLVDGVPTMVEALGVPPPFEHRIVVPPGSDVALSDLSVTGMGGATSRQTTCRITVDGRTVATSSADSAYGLVTCAVPAEPVD